VREPEIPPAFDFLDIVKCLWRNWLFGAEPRTAANHIRVYGRLESFVASVAHSHQHAAIAAIAANKEIRGTVSLLVSAAKSRVLDLYGQRSVRVGYICGAVFAAKVAIARPRMVCLRRTGDL
jgi:hypothetical protein